MGEPAQARYFAAAGAAPKRAGARLETRDPLAIVEYGKEAAAQE